MGRGRIALAAACGWLSACSLVYSAELSGARALADPADASGPIDRLDAQTASDSPTADVDGSPGLVGPGCARLQPAPKFCRDFDDDAGIGDGWTEVSGGPASSVVLDPAFSFSSPRSLTTTLTNAAGCQYGRLDRRFIDVGTRRQSVRTRIRPSLPWKGDKTILLMSLDTDARDTECAMLFYLSGDGAITTSRFVAQHGTQDAEHDVLDVPRPNEWTDLALVATQMADGVSFDVSVTRPDGSAHTTSTALPQCRLGPHLFVGVGFHCSEGSAEMRYDDVRVDWE